jgi:hypothetical protein
VCDLAETYFREHSGQWHKPCNRFRCTSNFFCDMALKAEFGEVTDPLRTSERITFWNPMKINERSWKVTHKYIPLWAFRTLRDFIYGILYADQKALKIDDIGFWSSMASEGVWPTFTEKVDGSTERGNISMFRRFSSCYSSLTDEAQERDQNEERFYPLWNKIDTNSCIKWSVSWNPLWVRATCDHYLLTSYISTD